MVRLRTREYFPHDYNARNDLKLQKLQAKQGLAGIGLYWCVVEIMYEQGGYIRPDECDSIAFALRTDAKALQDILTAYDLFVSDDNGYTSGTLQERLEARLERSEIAKSNAEKRWKCKRIAKALPSQCKGNAKIVKDRIGKDSIEKDIKTKHSFEDSPFFDYGKFKDALKEWPETKIRDYYERAKGYSGANGGKYLNWILAVKNWERADNKAGGQGKSRIKGDNTAGTVDVDKYRKAGFDVE